MAVAHLVSFEAVRLSQSLQRRRTMNINVHDIGLIITVTGIGLGVWIAKRKFNRTNESGVERFQSFTSMVVATTLDDVLYRGALVLIISGLFLMIFC